MRKLTKSLFLSLSLIMETGMILLSPGSYAQSPGKLTMEEAFQLARNNYPLIRQKKLITQMADLSIDNLQKGFLPQVTFTGQANYQSEVPEFKNPASPTGVSPIRKDQYKLVADVSQVVYDGSITREQKNLQQLNSVVEQQKVEVDLYKLNERISQVYLGILFLEEQLKQTDLVKSDITSGLKRVESQVDNGVALRSNVSLLQAELLKTEQRVIEIKASRTGLLQALGFFINQTLPEDIRLQTPSSLRLDYNIENIKRPELQLFSLQDRFLTSQEKLVDVKNLPRASVFFQGGYGMPGYNFLRTNFDFYYMGGVRLNWAIGGLYTQKKDKELLEVNRKMVDVQKETFLLNTQTSLVQQLAEINKLHQLAISDSAIIVLRVKVKEAAKAQLDNGVITANDYLREVNAEDMARRSLITHQLELLQAQINYKNISGNQ